MDLNTMVLLLALSPVLGVVALLFTRLFAQSQSDITYVGGFGNAIAASFMLYSSWHLGEEFYHDAALQPFFKHPLEAISRFEPAAIYFGCLAGGALLSILLVWKISKSSNTKSFVVAAVMFLHTASEGAGMGLNVGRQAFQKVFWSLFAHNIPEGFVVAVASLDSGLFKCIFTVIFSHIPQPLMMYLFATSGNSSLFTLPAEAQWFVQGVSLGSLVGTTFIELIPDAIGFLEGNGMGVIDGLMTIAITTTICAVTL